MLDAYIIEQIRRREAERRAYDRPALELPLNQAPDRARNNKSEDEEGETRVIVIDL